jgi:NAD(P)-dependent dehydrogenase (short-subunit alcohol dehydrogenase family)
LLALITGGVKNLGSEIALQFVPLGLSLALHYHSEASKKDATALAQLLKETSPQTKVVFYQSDLTSNAAVEKLFDAILQDFGGIDIVVNTIGMVLKKPVTEISEVEYDTMFA